MHPKQIGFRPGYSVDDCKYKLYNRISELIKEKKVKGYSCIFIDFSSAYDRAPR